MRNLTTFSVLPLPQVSNPSILESMRLAAAQEAADAAAAMNITGGGGNNSAAAAAAAANSSFGFSEEQLEVGEAKANKNYIKSRLTCCTPKTLLHTPKI